MTILMILQLLGPCIGEEDEGHRLIRLHASYSGEYSSITSTDLGATGWDTKDEKVTSAGSQASIDVTFLIGLHNPTIFFDFYSNNSLFPEHFGDNPVDDKGLENELELNRLLAGLGVKKFHFVYSRQSFSGKGVVRRNANLSRDGTPLRQGDEFDLAYTLDSYLLSATMFTNPEEDSGSKYERRHMTFGIGLTELSFLGVKEEGKRRNVERDVDGRGFTLRFDGLYGTTPIFSDKSKGYFKGKRPAKPSFALVLNA